MEVSSSQQVYTLSIMDKPYSQACENNKVPILNVIKQYFQSSKCVLEIGSGTGQHAVFFAEAMPYLTWQTSDVLANHPGINRWIDEADLPNLLTPIALNVNGRWPEKNVDGVFSANTAHIMSWQSVQQMFYGIASILNEGGHFCLYGPFNYDGQYTSESNRQFDGMLRERDPLSGIREFNALNALANKHGLHFVADHAMPANNRTLIWKK